MKILYCALGCLLALPMFAQAGLPQAESGSHTLYVRFEPLAKKADGQVAVWREHAAVNKVSLAELPLARTKGDGLSMLEDFANPLALRNSTAMDGVYVLYVRPEGDVEAVVESLEKNSSVASVEVAPEYHLCSGTGSSLQAMPVLGKDGWGDARRKSPDDPYYGTELGLNLKWHLDLINAEGAWAEQAGSSDIVVAVVDNAIWGEHEDLQIPKDMQYHCGTGEQTSSPLDMGVVLDQNEICEQSDLDYYTCESYNWSHGTHVTGLLAAVSGNGVGVASLGSGLSLLAVAAPSIQNYTLPGNPYEGMRWAANQGAKVINCSWAAYSSTAAEKELVAALVEEGVIIVAGAGNSNTYDEYNYPAALPGVISVGACNYDKTRARLSNYGGWVDVMAPGGQGPNSAEKVFSTTFCQSQVLPNAGYSAFEGEYYDYMEGSSMATPLVSALCGLILSKDPTVTPQEMEELIIATAQKGQNLGISEGSGIIDAEAALKAVDSRVKRQNPDFITSFTGACESGIAKIYWSVDAEAANKPEYLRLYRNGELLVDNLAVEDGSLRDTAAMAMNHKYEICGVSGGVETYREAIYVTIGQYYRLQAVADPAEAGVVYGSGRYEPRSQARLMAEANPGYRFVKWTYYDQWTGAEYENPTLILDMNQEYLGVVAHFEDEDAANEQASASQALKIFPNPVSDELNMVWPESFRVREVRIMDMTGALVMMAPADTERLDVSGLAPGMYLLQAIDENGEILYGKFMKR